jgi:hypothetical protein
MVSLLWGRWEFAQGPGVWVTGGCAVAVLGWGTLALTARDCTRELAAVDDPTLVGKVPLVFMAVCLLASAAGWAGSAAIGPDVGGAFVSAAVALCGAGLIATPVLARHAWARRMGLGFVAVAAAKVVIFDLAGVSAGWRTASVVLVGLVMLGVAVWYARVERKARGPSREGDSGPQAAEADGAVSP